MHIAQLANGSNVQGLQQAHPNRLIQQDSNSCSRVGLYLTMPVFAGLEKPTSDPSKMPNQLLDQITGYEQARARLFH